MQEKTCNVCQNKFHLNEHKFGLVYDDKIFVCENCTKNTKDDFLTDWPDSKMQHPDCGMPVALWLIQEQNKNKPPFSMKKR
jgi:hypothetical protein